MNKLIVDGGKLSLEDVVNVARHGFKVVLSKKSEKKIKKSRLILEKWIDEGKVVYGVTTGFGSLCTSLISPKKRGVLQSNLIRSHATNVGDSFSEEIVRAIMLVRINSLAMGYSGVKLETVNTYVDMLNKKVHPVVPQIGSVGASGDLGPLSHVALAAMGENMVRFKGKTIPALKAFKKTKIKPIKLDGKEGLALINGTSVMSAIGALLVFDAKNLVKTAEIASALSFETLKASVSSLNEVAHNLKPHPGQIVTAKNMRKLLKGSNLVTTNDALGVALEKEFLIKDDVTFSNISLQHAYTLRCIPQFIGAIRDAIKYVEERIFTEINSCTDNPLIIGERAFHGGHFHGQPVSLPLDVLSIALTELGMISERRINRFLDKDRSDGLPSFLIRKNVGLSTGFEGLQYTATSIIAENRTLCFPASVQSIPSNEENQDIVSMGLIAARKCFNVLSNTRYVIGIELMCGVEASDFRGKNLLSVSSSKTYDVVRSVFKPLNKDRFLNPEIEKVVDLIKKNKFVEVIEEKIGKLN